MVSSSAQVREMYAREYARAKTTAAESSCTMIVAARMEPVLASFRTNCCRFIVSGGALC